MIPWFYHVRSVAQRRGLIWRFALKILHRNGPGAWAFPSQLEPISLAVAATL